MYVTTSDALRWRTVLSWSSYLDIIENGKLMYSSLIAGAENIIQQKNT